MYLTLVPSLGISNADIQSAQTSATSFGSRNETGVDESEIYTLDAISSLIRLEDNIIFSLLERAQYCYNNDAYDPVLSSWMASMVLWSSSWSKKLKRSMLRLEDTRAPMSIHFSQTNYQILCCQICSVHKCCIFVLMISILTARYGIYTLKIFSLGWSRKEMMVTVDQQQRVTTSACRHSLKEFTMDQKRLMDLLTYLAVEETIKMRVETKTKTFRQVVSVGSAKDVVETVYKIKSSLVADLYEELIMALTKEVQKDYKKKKQKVSYENIRWRDRRLTKI